jgi:hypothetical protein
MSNETTKVGKMGEWQDLLQAIEANQDDLPELDTNRARLETVLGQAQQVARRQASHMAGKQEATQLLKGLMAEGQRLSTLLRWGLKQHYGISSEKLTEFGVQPFRGRRSKSGEEPTEAGTPASAQDEAPVDTAG